MCVCVCNCVCVCVGFEISLNYLYGIRVGVFLERVRYVYTNPSTIKIQRFEIEEEKTTERKEERKGEDVPRC